MKELKGKKRDGGSERWHKDLNVDFMLLPVSVRVSVGVEGVQCWEDFGETADGWELGAGWGGANGRVLEKLREEKQASK